MNTDLERYKHLRPRRGTVFVKLFPAEEMWYHGDLQIHRPDGYRNKRPRRGIVVALGPNAFAKVGLPEAPISDEVREAYKSFIKDLQEGPNEVIQLDPHGTEIQVSVESCMGLKPHLVNIGDEVLVVQWTLSLSKSGHPKEVTFAPFGLGDEEIIIVDEYKDIHAVIERDGPEDKAVIE